MITCSLRLAIKLRIALCFFSCFLLTQCKKNNTSFETIEHAAPIDNKGDIVVGEIGSLTGSEATFGISTRDGIELARQKINETGGIFGRLVQVVVYDDQGKPEEAASTITKLITQDKVIAVLGEVASSRSLAAAPIAQNRKIPMITPSSTNPKVTEIGDYIFRVCFIDPFQGTVMARFAYEHLHAKTAAVFRDTKSDYSIGLANYFVEAFSKLGGKIVKDEAYAGGDVHFKSQLTAIKNAAPDVVFVPGYYTEVGLIARQARQALNMTMPFLGGDGWDSPKLLDMLTVGGKSLDNFYFSNHYSQELGTKEVKEFVTDFEKTFHYKPDGLAAMGYDAAMVLFYAMKQTKVLTPQSIRDELAKVKDLKMVTGTISIDAKRNASKPAVVLKIENSQHRYVTTMSP